MKMIVFYDEWPKNVKQANLFLNIHQKLTRRPRSSAQFVVKPEGAATSGGQWKLGGREAPEGVKPPTTRQIEHCQGD